MEIPARTAPAGTAGAAGESSDAEVVQRVLRGEREVYRLLVSRYQDGLYRYALRMCGSGDVAADLVQNAFIKAYDRLHSCRDPAKFQPWIYRILANGCKDYLKNRRRRNVSLDDAGAARFPSRADPAQDLERSELHDTLERALAQLPEAQREAFLLKHMEGLSYEEIAERVGGSVSALKMRVHRARDALQELLTQQSMENEE